MSPYFRPIPIPATSPKPHQRGVVLFVALIVLVAMTLAGLAVVRTTDTGMLIAGNLAFRKNAKHSADIGVERARQWLMETGVGGPAALDNNVGSSYKATWSIANLTLDKWGDPNQWDWSDGGSAKAIDDEDGSGNQVRYVIHRMCANTGPVDILTCVTSPSQGQDKGAGHYGKTTSLPGDLPYYRITARVDGPRGTVAYIQSFIY